MAGLKVTVLNLTSQQSNMYKMKIDSVDNTIDKLVYELYGLTEEEIKVVEDSVKR